MVGLVSRPPRFALQAVFRLAETLCGRAVELHHQVVTKAIDNHPGQAVTVAVDQPVAGVFEQALPQGQGAFQSPANQRLVQGTYFTGCVQSRADQRMRFHAGASQQAAIRR